MERLYLTCKAGLSDMEEEGGYFETEGGVDAKAGRY